MIDFSSKHDVLLRDFDGTLRPMDEPYYFARKIADNTWQIISDGDYFYLAAGDEIGMCIDTGYGCGNVREFVEKLCGKPVPIVANSHYHFDHTANDSYFDECYMSAYTAKHAVEPMGSFDGIDFPKDLPIKIVEPGYVFHLGGRDIEVFSFSDHSEGAFAFLDRTARIFFMGDELSDWNKDLRMISVEMLERQLNVIWSHEKEYDWCCAGAQIFHKSYVKGYLANARRILEGHEGIYPVPDLEPHRNQVLEKDEQGRIIFNRRAHRLMDDGAMAHAKALDERRKKMQEAAPYMRFSDFAGTRIIYDVRNVFES